MLTRFEQEQDRKEFISFRVYAAGRYVGMLTHWTDRVTWNAYIRAEHSYYGTKESVLDLLLKERPRAKHRDYIIGLTPLLNSGLISKDFVNRAKKRGTP